MFVRAQEQEIEQVADGVTRQILGHDPLLMMVRVSFQKGAIGVLHSHPHRQVTYVERGTFDATIGDRTTVLRSGDCFLVPPDVLHGVVALEEGALIDVFTPTREDFLPQS
jgi:quercetin dioxygenase-like cupin family protein